MKIYNRERDFFHKKFAHHNHASNPEEEDVVRSLEKYCWVVCFEVFGFVWPAKGRKSPERRREPCVQNIGILLPTFAGWFFNITIHFLTSVPHWNSVSKPNLTGDTPITKVVDPVVISLCAMVWNNFDLA